MKDNKQLVLNIFISILVLAVIGVGLLVVFRSQENDTISAEEVMEQAANQTEAVEKWQEGDITYNGKKYRYNASVKAYLFLGIDKEGTMEETTGGLVGGQSDAMFVLITNAEAETISILSINRNSMTMVDKYDFRDYHMGQEKLQICLQHAYGEGGRESCLRTVDTVSRFLYGVPINGYFSMNMDGISILNDAVGGVTVTVMDDLENKGLGVSLKKGETVNLTGKEAYVYIRSRDINEFDSASRRLERQNQYLLSLFGRIKDLALGNEATIAKVSEMMEDYLVTSIDFVKLAEDASEYAFDESHMYNVPGETVMGEKYEEYYVDEDALYEMILELFYNEVEE